VRISAVGEGLDLIEKDVGLSIESDLREENEINNNLEDVSRLSISSFTKSRPSLPVDNSIISSIKRLVIDVGVNGSSTHNQNKKTSELSKPSPVKTTSLPSSKMSDTDKSVERVKVIRKQSIVIPNLSPKKSCADFFLTSLPSSRFCVYCLYLSHSLSK
jgi:hypothetical protein